MPRKGQKARNTPDAKARPKAALQQLDFRISLDSIAKLLVTDGRENGKAAFIELCRQVPDHRVRAVVSLWDHMKITERSKTPLEDLCSKAGLEPEFVLGQVTGTAWKFGVDVSKLIHGLNMPGVFKTLAAQAQTPEGFKDRELFLKISRAVPVGERHYSFVSGAAPPRQDDDDLGLVEAPDTPGLPSLEGLNQEGGQFVGMDGE